MIHFEPVTLSGRLVRLEPLHLKHAAELYEASRDPAIWTYMPVPHPPGSLADREQIISAALQGQQAGTCLPFAIIDLAQERVMGSTRYYNWLLENHGVEIGWTWFTPVVQRTGVNTECKYLLLRQAFEVVGAIRVQLRANTLNITSQRAIERLGAAKEGVLRHYGFRPDGSYRDSIVYSILESEWPLVKANLEAKMGLHPGPQTSRYPEV